MMGKLVTEVKDRVNNLNHECISLTEAEVRIEVISKVGLGLIMHIESFKIQPRLYGAEQDIVQIIEVVMVTI